MRSEDVREIWAGRSAGCVRRSLRRRGLRLRGAVALVAFVVEVEAFAGLDFAAGADEGGPDVFVGVLSVSCWVRRTSMRPVGSGELCWVWRPARVAKRRAGRTRESLRMRRSPAFRCRGDRRSFVGVGAGAAVHDEHAAGAADGGRGLGDEFFGEVEVEVGDAH